MIRSLSDEDRAKGIVCASAGNHAQGVAYSCKALGIKGKIFMPSTTPNQKIKQVRRFGGEFVEVILKGIPSMMLTMKRCRLALTIA